MGRRDRAGGADDGEPIEVELVTDEDAAGDPDDGARHPDAPRRAVSGAETVGGGRRDRVAESFQLLGERFAALPLRMRAGISALVVLALAGLLTFQISRAPVPPPALQLRVAGASFAAAREGNGLTLSVLLHNDAAVTTVVYRSTFTADGLQPGQTTTWPLAALAAGGTFVYGFDLPFDCEPGGPDGTVGGSGARTTPRAEPTRLMVTAMGRDGVRRDVQLAFGDDPWRDFATMRRDYCASPEGKPVSVVYEGNRDPVDQANRLFRLVLSVTVNGPDPVPIIGVTQSSTPMELVPENIPTTVQPGVHGVLLIDVKVLDCAAATSAPWDPAPYVTVTALPPDRTGPVRIRVPIPPDVLRSQVAEVCPG